MIIDEVVVLKWNGNNRRIYEPLGYKYTKLNDEFTVNIGDVKLGASVEVNIKCDYCGKNDKKNLRHLKNKEINFCSKECVDKYKKGKSLKEIKSVSVLPCNFCGKEFEISNWRIQNFKHHFCTNACRDQFRKGKPNEKNRNGSDVKCHICKNQFYLPNYRIKSQERHFCSRECQIIWQKSNEYKLIHKNAKRKRSEVVDVLCAECGIVFAKKKHSRFSETHFCNIACRTAWMKNNNSQFNPNPKKDKVKVNCDYCGKDKYVNEAKAKANKYHFCSRGCYASWRSENMSGENMYNYNRIDSECENCKAPIKITPWQKENSAHNFCTQECYWEFRGKFYIGDKHPMFGTTLDEERRNQIRDQTLKRLSEGDFNKQTSIEKKVNQLLDKMSIKYEDQKVMKYYCVDNYLTDFDLIVEVMGDYFHANPTRYKFSTDLNNMQRKDVKRDKSKNTYFKRYHNIEILYLWESDVNKNIELCEKLIELYIQNKGVLPDYHSYNYFMHNGELYLNNDIVKPFFKRRISNAS